MSEVPRPGQKAALDTIIARFARGESYTAIVLPTRYGKSDVIRASTLVACEQGLISCALVLSPTGFLVKQIVKAEKWSACLRRFNAGWLQESGYAPIGFQPAYARLDRVKARPNANGEHLLSATIQLVNRNADIFCEWVESQRHRTGRPVAVFVDESHTGSDGNEWGKSVKKLAAAGALVVLLTATAERSDGKTIPGFKFDEVDTEPVTVYVPGPGSEPKLVKVDVYEGVKRRLRLRPDHETFFGQAFDEDALAKISFTPVDVDLAEIAGASFAGPLSQLPASRVPAALDKTVRHPEFVRAAVAEFVTSLMHYRSFEPRTLGIIFSGNDDKRHGASRGDNQHAEMIRAEVARHAGSRLTLRILTSLDENAEDDLLAFCVGGLADVAIVKQMGGLGLDSELLKVGLDLSNVRTYAACVQRLMRVATPPPLVAHWIAPADILSRAVFQRVVADEGGEAKAADLTLIDSYEVERKEKEKEVWRVGAVTPGDFDDSQQYHGSREEYAGVQHVLSKFPALAAHYTHAYIADSLRGVRLEMPQGEPDARNTGDDCEALYAEVNQVADEAVRDLMRARHSWDNYGDTIRELFNLARSAVSGWPCGSNGKWVELRACSDLTVLTALRDELQHLHSRILAGEL